MNWNLGQIGREAARVAGAPMTVAYGPADHAYEVAASAEGPVGRGGRSRPIASFGLFRAITGDPEGVNCAATPRRCTKLKSAESCGCGSKRPEHRDVPR